MNLVHDILDEQLVDRRNRAMGKIDGLVLDVEAGRPPRIVAIEVGPVTLARRLHPALARWVLAVTRRLGVGSGAPLRVPIARVRKQEINLQADVDLTETPAFAWERWLRDRVIGRIPGSGWRLGAAEVRLEDVLGRRILAPDGRAIGRLEEVVAEWDGTDLVVTRYLIGVRGLFERLFGEIWQAPGGGLGPSYAPKPDQVDLTDPRRPRLTCPVSALDRLESAARDTGREPR